MGRGIGAFANSFCSQVLTTRLAELQFLLALFLLPSEILSFQRDKPKSVGALMGLQIHILLVVFKSVFCYASISVVLHTHSFQKQYSLAVPQICQNNQKFEHNHFLHLSKLCLDETSLLKTGTNRWQDNTDTLQDFNHSDKKYI